MRVGAGFIRMLKEGPLPIASIWLNADRFLDCSILPFFL